MPIIPRLYIFDADGTLRWTTIDGARYPVAPGEWRLMPGVRERLASIPWSTHGPWLAVASNQCGVGEGRLGRGLAHGLIADAVVAAVGRMPPGARIEMCTCPEGAACPRQKPAPGLLLAALAHFGVAAHEALYVGDLPADELAARRAGVPFRWAQEFFSAAPAA